MANLSNINGKFVVEQTTGYVGVGTTDPSYPIEVLNASAEIALNASGGSIYRLRSDSTDSFRINKNGVGDRLVIDGSGYVGISVSTPSDYYAKNLVVTGPAEGGITIASTGNHTNYLLFADSTSGAARYAGMVGYAHDTDLMSFRTNSIQRMAIDSSGNINIGTGAASDTYIRMYNASSGDITAGYQIYNGSNLDLNIYTNPLFGNSTFFSRETFSFNTSAGAKVKILNNGNVGIGVTGPGVQLEVGKSATIGAGSVSTSITNHENVLKVKGKNNYSDGTTWYGDYGQILLSADSNMTGSAHQFLITNALDNNKFAIVRSADANTVPVVNSTANGVNSGTADFVIDGGGNVGIGVTSPGAKLEVRSDAANPDYGVYFHNSGGGRVLKIYNTDWDAGDNLIYASNGGTATPSLGYEFVVTGNAKVHLTASDAYFEAAGAGGTPGTDSMLFGQNSTKVGYVWNRSTISTAHILFGTSSTERMRITNGGVVQVGTVPGITPAILSARKNGTCIEFGHSNNTGRYEGTLGVFGSSGNSYIGFATSCDNSANTFTTRGGIGNVIDGDNNGNLNFQQATNANASGQTLTQRMRISNVGRVTINTTIVTDARCTIAGDSSHYALNLYADVLYSSVYRYQRFRSGSNIAGGIEGLNQTSVVYNTSSDYRMKKNIKPLENGLERLSKLKPVKFDWKLNDESTEGFIAHEVQKIFPDAISGEKDGEDMQGMDYGRITPLLVAAIQELKAEIEILKNK